MQAFLAGVKPVFIFFNILFFFGFAYSLSQGWKYRPHLSLRRGAQKAPTIKRAVAEEEWRDIRRKFAVGTTASVKLAIMEADKFVDTILKSAGYAGDHMADRLEKIIPDDIASVNRLWEAHRFRNELVHSPDFEFAQPDAEKAMQDYEAFLQEIHIIDKT